MGFICIFVKQYILSIIATMKTLTKLYESFLQDAKEAQAEWLKLTNELKAYALASPLSASQLKKDPTFINLSKKMVATKKLWYDYNLAALIQAKEEKVKSVLN